MVLKVLLVLLPILCDAEIKINVTVASNKDFAKLQYSGQDVKLVTSHEIDLFNITMTNLNRGFRVELGKVPDGIFLKDPTTYGNLFHKYKWSEIRRHLLVEKIEIIEIINKEMELRTHEVFNNATDNSQVKRTLFETVETSVFSTWSDKGMPHEDIVLDMNINFEGSSFHYKDKWKENTLKSKTVKFGKSFKRKLTIKPGQTILEKLSATKTICVLKIDFVAKLNGNVVGDYENLYGKYHFWAPTINNIMKAAGVPNEIRTSERVEIRCFTDPKLDIIDKDTGMAMPLRVKRKLVWKLKSKKWS